MLADTVIKQLGFDKVLFVPAYMPPHKIMSLKISAQHRLNMIKEFCAAEGNGFFEAEPCEIERGGISYTSDTLEFLTQKYKNQLDGKLAFIMGDEVAAEFNKWHKPEQIAQLADFIITHRYEDVVTGNKSFMNKPAANYKGDFKEKFTAEKFGHPLIELTEPVLPVSSTDIRNRIAEGKSFRYLLPASVYEYIVKNNLYKNQETYD